MRPRAGALALLLAAGLAAGPATAGASEQAASAPDANLFVYRDSARPAGCAAELLLDGKRFAALAQHSYTSLKAPPGVHQLQLRWAAGCGHGEVTNQLDVAPRRLYYFAVGGGAQTTLLAPGLAHTTWLHETTSLVPVDPDAGVQSAGACCRFVPASRPF